MRLTAKLQGVIFVRRPSFSIWVVLEPFFAVLVYTGAVLFGGLKAALT